MPDLLPDLWYVHPSTYEFALALWIIFAIAGTIAALAHADEAPEAWLIAPASWMLPYTLLLVIIGGVLGGFGYVGYRGYRLARPTEEKRLEREHARIKRERELLKLRRKVDAEHEAFLRELEGG